MLGDNNREKELQRNQIIAILLMTVLVVGWSYFFLPEPPPQEPPKDAPATTEPPAEPTSKPTTPPDLAPVGEAAPAKAPRDAAGDIAAALPPIPAENKPETFEVDFATPNLELVFTRVGARLKRATVLLGENGEDATQLVPVWGNVPDSEAVYPLGLRFAGNFLGDALDQRLWTLEERTGDSARFSLETPDVARVAKHFQFAPEPHVLEVDVRYTNLQREPQLLGLDTGTPAVSLNWGPNISSGDEKKGVKQTIIWPENGELAYHATSDLEPPPAGAAYSEWTQPTPWMAVRSAYFVMAMKPAFEQAKGWAVGNPEHFRVGVGAPRVEVAPGETVSWQYRVYLGPNKAEPLAAAWQGLDGVWKFFTMFEIMDKFAKLLLGVLKWFHGNVIANYGLAIIFLTLLVRGAMFPLTLKSMKSMKKMQLLAPEIEKLKEEAGEDQQELQKRMLELYKERGVNPLGGCLPILLQLPVFIALYRMLWSAVELRRAPFIFWIQDLSEPDGLFQLPFEIPLPFGATGIDSLNLLPILMGVSMLLSQKLMPTSGPVQNPQQKMLMTFMPIVFSVLFYNMAAGLCLYILTSTLLGIAQNYFVHVSDAELKAKKPKKKPRVAGRHFYTAAQARKREMAKEVRREKKSRQRSAASAKEAGKNKGRSKSGSGKKKGRP